MKTWGMTMVRCCCCCCLFVCLAHPHNRNLQSQAEECMQMTCDEADQDGQCRPHAMNQGGACSQHANLGMMDEKCNHGQWSAS